MVVTLQAHERASALPDHHPAAFVSGLGIVWGRRGQLILTYVIKNISRTHGQRLLERHTVFFHEAASRKWAGSRVMAFLPGVDSPGAIGGGTG
jgi:hypothetical protein